MVEPGHNRFSIGHIRLFYLKEADIAMAQEQFGVAEGYISAFVATIQDGSKAAEQLTHEFDKIEEERSQRMSELSESMKGMGALERRDMEVYKDELEIDTLRHKRVACWRIATNNGLFLE